MINFKKDYSSKIISLIVAWVFFLNSNAHGIDLPENTHLRAPLLSNSIEGRERVRDELKAQITSKIIDYNKDQLDQFVTTLSADSLNGYFSSLDELIDDQGFEKSSVTLRYLFVKLILAGGSDLIEKSKVMKYLSKEEKEYLVGLFRDKAQLTFSDVARFVIAAAIDRPGFKGFHGFEQLKGSCRILIVGPYSKEARRAGQFLPPPAGAHRIACFLRVFGFHVDVVDPYMEKEEALAKRAADNKYDVVMFSIFDPILQDSVELMQILRQAEGTKDSVFIGGGPGAVPNRDLLLQEQLLQLVSGGIGEFPALDIGVQYHKETGNGALLEYENIKGLYIRGGNGDNGMFTGKVRSYRRLDMRVISHTIDFRAISYPDYWEYNRFLKQGDRFLKNIKSDEMGFNVIRLYTELLCPYDCSMCTAAAFLHDAVEGRQPMVVLSPEDRIWLIEKAVEAYPELTGIYFGSDNFMVDIVGVYKTCDLIEQRLIAKGIRLKYSAVARADSVDPIILHRQQEVGFIAQSYGIESSVERILKDVNKRIQRFDGRKYAERAMRLAEKAGYPIPDSVMKRLKPYLESDVNSTVTSYDVIVRAMKESIAAGLATQATIMLFWPTADMSDIIKTVNDISKLIEMGVLINTFTYVEPYGGTGIAKRGYETIDIKMRIGDIDVDRPVYVLPLDAEVRKLASEVVEPSSLQAVRIAIRKRYKFDGTWTQILETLSIFWSVCHYANIPKIDVEKVLESVMEQYGERASASTLTALFEGSLNRTDLSTSSRHAL